MPSYEEALAETLRRGRPAAVTTPVMPDIEGRPDINKLLAGLQTVSEKPVDLSGVQRVSKARREQAERDMVAGMVLSSMGGQGISPLGRTLAQQGIEGGKPLRLNTADEALEDPTTGEMVVNPLLQQKREDAQRQAVAQALIREQAGQAAVAGRQTAQASTDVNADVGNLTKAILSQVAQQNAESNRIRAEAAATKAGAEKPPKAIPVSQVKDLEDNASGLTNLKDLQASYKDSHSGMGPLSTARVYAESQLGGLAPKESQERAYWWSKFKMFQELPQRHQLFGATLTTGEQKAWDAAQSISPRSSPETIKKALKGLEDAVAARQGRLTAQLRREGKDPSAYEAPKGDAAPASVDDLIKKYGG